MSDSNETRLQYIARMEEEGLVPSYPGPNELQIDIDSEEDWARHQASWLILQRELGMEDFQRKVTPSRSGGVKRHVRITMDVPLTSPTERIAWQAALGSDPLRELLSLVRWTHGDEHPTLLMERK